MNEEQLNNNEVQTNESEYDVVAEVNKIKESMVDKADYDKLRAERDKYAKALVEGTKVDVNKQSASVDDLRKKLFNSDNELSNLDYVQTALELRQAILDNGGDDIFVGRGSKLTPDDNDYAKAKKVAEALQSCIDNAEGNSEIFTRELMRITEDVKIPNNFKRRI